MRVLTETGLEVLNKTRTWVRGSPAGRRRRAGGRVPAAGRWAVAKLLIVPAAALCGGADFDSDRDVDLTDFARLQVCFRQSPVASCLDVDLDRDGRIDATDLAIFETCFSGPAIAYDPRCLPRFVVGSFSRPGPAYLSDSSSQQFEACAADVPRKTEVLSVGASDGEIRVGEIASGKLRTWCSNRAGLYAFSDRDSTQLYRSSNGLDNWELVYSAEERLKSLFTLEDERLIGFTHLGHALFSDDDGVSWTECRDAGETLTLARVPAYWGLHQRPRRPGELHGTIIIGTYWGGGSINQLWRSTDNGASWTKVHEIADGMIYHFHSICYHVAKETWIADTGDGPARQFTFLSADDGATWTGYTPGDFNYLSNPGFETGGAEGWEDGEQMTLVTTNDSPMTGAFSARIRTSTEVSEGDYVSYSFALPEHANHTRQCVAFQARPRAGYAVGYLRVAVHDGTEELPVTPADRVFSSAARGQLHFFDTTTSNTYELRFKVSGAGAAHDFTVDIDSVRVGHLPSFTGQVTRFRDFGHPTRLAFGSDWVYRVGWCDLETFEVGSFLDIQTVDHTGANYFFEFF